MYNIGCLLKKSLSTLLLLFSITMTDAAEIYVSTRGSDQNPGTKEKPLATVEMALRKARELRRLNDPSIKNGIQILVAKGIYELAEAIFIRPEDSGTEDSPTLIKGLEDGVVLSGGRKISGWKKLAAPLIGLAPGLQGKIWVADQPMEGGRHFEFRQLWVNQDKAIRARERNGDSMSRILSWDHAAQTCWIPKPLPQFKFSEGMEMVIHQWWAIAILRIRSVETRGDSSRLFFHQPESRVQSEHPWPAPWISKESGNSAFYLSNALSFLDQPGEWYLDQQANKIYYYPRAGEDLTKATVTAPYLETILTMEGTIDHPVANVSIENISFQHSSWLRPSLQGHVPHQAGLYMLDAYKLKIPGTPDKKSLENQAWVGRPAAAVEVAYSNNTSFVNCRFEHLASTGLDYQRANQHDRIEGNLFRDIGGSAILAGVFSDEATEVHLPYLPADDREVTSHLSISNNLVNDATNEDWGCVGIGAGYVRDIEIAQNEICEVSYSGISLGWGWTKTVNAMRNNRVTGNRIHHYAKHMYDVAGVYTLSAQPGTLITGNHIDSIYKAPYAHIPSHWFYLYTDEGSSYMTVKDNWCPTEKFLQNANGPGNTWTNNGPMVADSIHKAAGLQPKYRHLLKEKKISRQWPVNRVETVTHGM
jgi:hypothetical protein